MIASGELSAYAADHMVVSIYEEGGMEKTNQLLASDAWRNLPAVREDRVYAIPVTKCFANDGVSLQKLTDMLVDMLHSRQNQK
ncbi:ABC transporter substrate-binding protein [Bacillus sp. FJAT-26390]|uniref:ABC transporter substrate-binding protein n=1 Tax=Bacillus sp. FJAT-26390 TaxID=1743142 RepID=UPI000807A5D1|nr:ABC transporter substrate-binding protein [Bacillus sp. FJAT-26390]OBZ15500.1 hypothetical protein A7975_31440 [Bacillus sp. FJAT-26390]